MKIRIKFSKQGAMKFIGHLDTMRYFQKVMRRADVDIRYSEGFSPHQIMSFAAPLGVGLTGSGEYLDIQILAASGKSHTERCRKGHDLVRGETFGITDIYIRAAHGLLEIAHRVEMSDELHGSLLGKLNSDLHNRHLLQIFSRRIPSISSGSSG